MIDILDILAIPCAAFFPYAFELTWGNPYGNDAPSHYKFSKRISGFTMALFVIFLIFEFEPFTIFVGAIALISFMLFGASSLYGSFKSIPEMK
jgi:hypothetical protein